MALSDIDRLIMAGQALYGERWQSELTRTLGLSDSRRMRQWVSGDRPIPDGVFGNIVDLLKDRKKEIDGVIRQLS